MRVRLTPTVFALLVFGLHPIAAESPSLQVGQIIETKTGQSIAFDDWITNLAASAVIYLGEEHRNRSHTDAAIRILEALQVRDRRPILALEMFAWDGQSALDRYLADSTMTREQFLQDSHWEQNWGGAYADYEPLISFAREHHVPVLALNPPRLLVRRVASEGWARAMTSPEVVGWGMQGQVKLDDEAYRDVIFKQLRSCHDSLSDDAYQRMFEASVFRDEGMARTISDYLSRKEPGHGPLLSYTGAGHIQYRLPIPNRVLRRQTSAVRQTTVYLAAFDPSRTEEIRSLLQEPIADYVWLTPVGAHGSPRRCR